ncbi:MAG: leucine--tRNA ligase [Rhodobacterales bacterium]|nr:leucine--tRNA ligase [Rhodobacterales bacterium]
MSYTPANIESKWQQFWDEDGTFVVHEDDSRTKFYALSMFPYPSGKGLHVGHPAGYTACDVVSRFKAANGFNVMQPMGYDSFGLPAEQKAIEEGVAPQISTAESINTFRGQLKRLGYAYDWEREVSTCDPEYYKWTQYIFTVLYHRGLIYQSDLFVNWCSAMGTVLANDEVINGKSERGGHPVERKAMRQWMIRITDYAERLLQDLDNVDWPEATKARQRDWIGKSEGAVVQFKLQGRDDHLEVFTTRPDTLWGATYMVVAPEHPIVQSLATDAQREAVTAYQAETAAKSELDRQQVKEKTGIFTGSMAINPVTGEAIPVWIADYVIYGYGTGAIMAVPAHDERDWAFAKAMGLSIIEVVSGGDVQNEAYAGDGELVNSGAFNGTPTANNQAVAKVIEYLESQNMGSGKITYRLRDWTFARQRYWGEPIPVLKKDGEVVRVLDVDELPLVLPLTDNYTPTGTGASPLSAVEDWVHIDGMDRETDTMPGSAGSSWYFLRYCDPRNVASFCDRSKSDYWMPVDLYVGGPEHTVGHLLYARLWQKVLFDAGLVRDDEPFKKLRHQGMIQSFTYYTPEKRIVPQVDVEKRDGKFFKAGTDVELSSRIEKMSKRKGNVINPDDIIKKYGADAMRIYICFMGPLESDKPWQTNGLDGQFNWLKRVWRLFFDDEDQPLVNDDEASEAALKLIHKTIKKVTHDIENMAFNTAISAMHIATRDLTSMKCHSREVLTAFAQLLAPFAPHLGEELWTVALGNTGTVNTATWPAFDEAYTVDATINIGVQIMGKTRGQITIAPDADQDTALAAAKADPVLAGYLEGKNLVRVIYIKGRILNLIAK